MKVVLVGGCEHDEFLLARAFTGAERGFELERAGLPAAQPLRALVFEAADRPEFAKLGLALVRAEPHFDDVPLLLAVRFEKLGKVDPKCGFDDLLIEPYGQTELAVRLNALAYRHVGSAGREQMGDIVLDHRRREVEVGGRPVTLTGREFALFAFLWTQRGRVLSRRTLLQRVWGEDYEVGPRTVDIHVRRLRVKLGDTVPLETLRGAGYKLRLEPARQPAPQQVEARQP